MGWDIAYFILATHVLSHAHVCARVQRLQCGNSGGAAGREPAERGRVALHTRADPSVLTPCLLSLSGSPGAVEVCGSLGYWSSPIGLFGQAEVLDLSKGIERP